MTEVMAEIHFTSWLRQVVPDGPLQAVGATVGDVLGTVFSERPHVRGYVVDEQGRLRKHVCIFVDGKRLPHQAALAHAIRPNSRLYVMQALSGG
jgi:sulfur-carrier protein